MGEDAAPSVFFPVFSARTRARNSLRERVAASTRRDSAPGPAAHQLLSAIPKSAVESGLIALHPCVGVSLPRARRREMHILSAPQVAGLAQAIRPPYGTLVYLLAYGGHPLAR